VLTLAASWFRCPGWSLATQNVRMLSIDGGRLFTGSSDGKGSVVLDRQRPFQL
jgi:hypothetical protein